MRSDIPRDMLMCAYFRGDNETSSVFMIQAAPGTEPVPYVSFGCDDDGVFLVSEDGHVTHVEGEGGIECYEHTADCDVVRLQVWDDMGDFHSEFDIARLPREHAMAIGA